jgi:type II secretory pathway component PulF
MLILVLGLILPSNSDVNVDLLGIGVGWRGLLNYFVIISTVIGTITFFVVAIVKGWFGLDSLLQFIVRIPVIGPAFQTMALSQMAWTLSMALGAGVDAKRSMTMALNATQTPYYTRHIPRIERMIEEEGREFHDVLRATNGFPEDFVNSLEAAEISGTASESMERLAVNYQARAKTAMKLLTAAATFAIWGMVAMVLIILIFRMFFLFILGPVNQALDDLGPRR